MASLLWGRVASADLYSLINPPFFRTLTNTLTFKKLTEIN
jgi:hypothetical protein